MHTDMSQQRLGSPKQAGDWMASGLCIISLTFPIRVKSVSIGVHPWLKREGEGEETIWEGRPTVHLPRASLRVCTKRKPLKNLVAMQGPARFMAGLPRQHYDQAFPSLRPTHRRQPRTERFAGRLG